MIGKISKANEREALEMRAFFNALLDEVQMNGHDRLRAKASLARAEAFADAVVGVIDLFRRLLKTLILRPIRNLTAAG